jgi:hypothetical protein
MKQYLAINHHENVSRGSQKFANHLINYCYNKLLASDTDPQIAAIIAVYVVYVNNWNAAYAGWHDALNFQMSTTAEMEIWDENLIKTKAPEWAGKIWGVYPQGTPKATALLPHGRHALITGTPIDKASGINTLIDGIGADAALATVKSDLQLFVSDYTEAYQKQQAAIKALKEKSKDQEQLRLLTTGALLFCEGSLIAKFWQNSEKVDLFFDISSMRMRHEKAQPDEPILISLLPDEIKLIDLDYTFEDIWEVTNAKSKDACVFFGNTSTITEIPANKTVILAGQTVKVDLNTLTHEMRFAYAANLSAEDEGELSFKLLSKE